MLALVAEDRFGSKAAVNTTLHEIRSTADSRRDNSLSVVRLSRCSPVRIQSKQPQNVAP
jgi:hypothetical protein